MRRNSSRFWLISSPLGGRFSGEGKPRYRRLFSRRISLCASTSAFAMISACRSFQTFATSPIVAGNAPDWIMASDTALPHISKGILDHRRIASRDISSIHAGSSGISRFDDVHILVINARALAINSSDLLLHSSCLGTQPV